MPDENPMSTTLFIGFLLILLLFYFIFSTNPYGIIKHFRIPVMILCLVTVFGILIFIEYYKNQDIYQKDSTSETGSNFIKYLRKYGLYLFYFTAISLLAYVGFKIIEKGFLFTFKISFWLTMGLLVLVLALFSKSTEKMTFDSPTLDLLKNIIMYIPCLLTDAIDFMKKDYENTPSTVFIVFLMILVYVSIFYLYPFIREVQYQNDGILLIDSPRYLNENVLSMTSEELKEKILDKRPFYDRWFHRWAKHRESTKQTSSPIQLEGKKEGDSIQLLVPPDSITYPYYLKEGFASIAAQEANLIPFEDFERRVTKMYGSLFDFADEDIARERMKQFIIDHPEILTVLEKIQYLYSVAFASWDTLMYSPQILLTGNKVIEDNIYHYSLSSWIYLQPIQSREKQLLFSFGSRPSLYYDPVLSTLCVYTNYLNDQRKLLYTSDKILFQRWIFVVMNYNYGTLDLFINNNLVGTYPNVVSYIDPTDLLIVGSDENQNIGGICNMKYYELPIGSRKINSIYTTFHNKKIPI